MSDILQRTMASLPGLLSSLGASTGQANSFGASSGMLNFFQSICTVKSKYAETQLVQRELSLQNQKLTNPSQTTIQKRDSLIRLLFCHLLGYDVSFAYIHAVKLAQQGSILEKRVGYIVCAAFLNDSHEFSMLLINTILKDLSSTNILEVCTALIAAGHLVSSEMIPSLLPSVKEKLKHSKEIIRRKAVLCLRAFIMKVPELSSQLKPLLTQAIGDKDPGVMWAALEAHHQLIQDDGSAYVDLVPTLVDILEQIISRKLPSQFDFHTVPSPWLTISILKLLAILGKTSESAKKQISPVLQDVLQRTEPSHTAGLAVIYETLLTIAFIDADPHLLSLAARCVSRFLSAKSINLKYIGIKLLSAIVQIDDRYALEHQSAVIDCLEHEDVTIQKATLFLLSNMANQVNKKVICDRLLDYANRTTDRFSRVDIITKVLDIADRFSDDVKCYLEQMVEILDKNGDIAPTGTADKLIEVVKSGLRNDKTCAENDRFKYALNIFWEKLKSEALSDALLQVAVWTVGEYSHLDSTLVPDSLISCLVGWYSRCSNNTTQKWILSALCKRHAFIQHPNEVIDILKNASDPADRTLQQRLHVLATLCSSSPTVKEKLEFSTSPFPQQMDFSLSFLDCFVADALETGALPYRTASMRLSQSMPQKSTETSFVVSGVEPSEASDFVTLLFGGGSVRSASAASCGSSEAGGSETSGTAGLQMRGVKSVWGAEGLVEPNANALAPVSGDAPTSVHQIIDIQASVDQEELQRVKQRKQLADALFGGVGTSAEEKREAADEDLSETRHRLEGSISPDSIESSTDQDLRLVEVQNPVSNSGASSGDDQFLVGSNATSSKIQTTDSFKSSVVQSSKDASGSSSSSDKQYLVNDELVNDSQRLRLQSPSALVVNSQQDSRADSSSFSSSNNSDFYARTKTSDFDIRNRGDLEAVGCDNDSHRSDARYEPLRDSELCLERENSDPRLLTEDRCDSDMDRNDNTTAVMGQLVKVYECDVIVIFFQKLYRSRSLQFRLVFNRSGSAKPDIFRDATVCAVDSSHIYQAKFMTNRNLVDKISLQDLCQSETNFEATLDVRPSSVPLMCQKHLFSVDLLFCVPATGVQASFGIPVHLADFIRPNQCSLQSFAEFWVSYQPECRQVLFSDKRDITAVAEMLSSRCQLRIVQISGSECILAGQILDSECFQLLLHAKVSHSQTGATLYLWMKSADRCVLDCLVPAVIVLLSD